MPQRRRLRLIRLYVPEAVRRNNPTWYRVPIKELDVVQHATLRLYVERLRRRSGASWEVTEIRRTPRLVVALLTTANGANLRVIWRPSGPKWSVSRSRL